MPENEDLIHEADTQGTAFIPCGNIDNDHSDEPYVDGPLARSEFDLPDGPLLRFQAYRHAWDICLYRVKEIVHKLQRPVVDSIVESVQATYVDTELILPSCELASLVVSSPDRTSLYEVLDQISSILYRGDDEEPHYEKNNRRIPRGLISRLSELDCMNVAAMMKSLIKGFISQSLGDTSAAKIKFSSSLAPYDMNILKAWYESIKNEYGSGSPKLVVVIPGLHAIGSDTLQDVLEICSLYIPYLPLVFILGTPDSELLHSVLPRSTLACLRVDKFVLPWNIKTLEHIIRETYFSLKFVPDVMLGPVALEKMFQEFKRDNATLDALLSTLQLLHMQHFYHPLSFLVHPKSEAVLYEVSDSPPGDWMRFLRLLRSYCVQSLLDLSNDIGPAEWSKITPREIIRTVFDARTTFRKLANKMKLAVNVLETILTFVRGRVKDIPAINFEGIALEALRGSDDGARGVSNLIRQLSLAEAEALLDELYRLLHNVPSSTRNDAIELKQKVVVVKKDITKKSLVEFVDSLETYFSKTLLPFEIPCIDIWWTGEINIPHSPLNPNPHISIVTALLEPQKYLGWVSPMSLPDASILFRRYVDSGRMINVYDWFESFSVALEGDTLQRDDDRAMDVNESPTKGKSDGKARTALKRKLRLEEADDDNTQEAGKREVQARFMRSLHELEFVGFWKHSGRKADHVAKTVFDILG